MRCRPAGPNRPSQDRPGCRRSVGRSGEVRRVLGPRRAGRSGSRWGTVEAEPNARPGGAGGANCVRGSGRVGSVPVSGLRQRPGLAGRYGAIRDSPGADCRYAGRSRDRSRFDRPRRRTQAVRLPRMTTRRWMFAVAVVAAVLGFVASTHREAGFRRWAQDHGCVWFAFEMRDMLRDPAERTLRERVAKGYHLGMCQLLNGIADLLGEPERLDAFPGMTFEDVVRSVQDSPGSGGFPGGPLGPEPPAPE